MLWSAPCSMKRCLYGYWKRTRVIPTEEAFTCSADHMGYIVYGRDYSCLMILHILYIAMHASLSQASGSWIRWYGVERQLFSLRYGGYRAKCSIYQAYGVDGMNICDVWMDGCTTPPRTDVCISDSQRTSHIHIYIFVICASKAALDSTALFGRIHVDR